MDSLADMNRYAHKGFSQGYGRKVSLMRTSRYGEEDNEEDTYPLGGDIPVWIPAKVWGLGDFWRRSGYEKYVKASEKVEIRVEVGGRTYGIHGGKKEESAGVSSHCTDIDCKGRCIWHENTNYLAAAPLPLTCNVSSPLPRSFSSSPMIASKDEHRSTGKPSEWVHASAPDRGTSHVLKRRPFLGCSWLDAHAHAVNTFGYIGCTTRSS